MEKQRPIPINNVTDSLVNCAYLIKSSYPCLGKHTFGSRWTAAGQFHRYFSQQQLVVLVIAGELSQAGKCFLDTRKTVLFILDNQTVFIVKSKWSLQKEVVITTFMSGIEKIDSTQFDLCKGCKCRDLGVTFRHIKYADAAVTSLFLFRNKTDTQVNHLYRDILLLLQLTEPCGVLAVTNFLNPYVMETLLNLSYTE